MANANFPPSKSKHLKHTNTYIVAILNASLAARYFLQPSSLSAAAAEAPKKHAHTSAAAAAAVAGAKVFVCCQPAIDGCWPEMIA